MKLSQNNILITGGAGYIGSHVGNFLIDNGYKVCVIDSLITGNKQLVPKKAELFICDIADTNEVTKIIKSNKFDLVMHFAGLISVDESIEEPKKYNQFNYEKAKIFLNTCFKNNLKKIIFSSTASVYGNPQKNKISENEPTIPLNPYAESKLKLENFIIKKSETEKINYIILRYFNVAGADNKLRTGLISKSSNNLIKTICEVAIGKKDLLTINGNDYNTTDGTPIRDFIHVSDLAEIHSLTAKYLIDGGRSEIFNCGYGKGFTVMEVIKNMNNILQSDIVTLIGKRRKKDIESSVANTKKFNSSFQWKPRYDNLEYILKSALDWEKKIKD